MRLKIFAIATLFALVVMTWPMPAHASIGCSGTIGDFVWNDQNTNGIQNTGEPGINGVVVKLFDGNGTFLTSTTTGTGPSGNTSGYYQFTKLCAGTYKVQVDTTTLPNGGGGWFAAPTNVGSSTTDSNPNPSVVTLGINSSNQTIDFGFYAKRGAIGDYVWVDTNGNGIQDTGETGLNGVTVALFDNSNHLIATTATQNHPTTGTPGYYQFTGLAAGDYVVQVDIPQNFTPSPAHQGSNTAIDSNIPTGDGVTLPTGTNSDETTDFGLVPKCGGTIGDFVWYDADRNGVQDTGEPGLNGVVLLLFDSNGIQVATTTSTTGPVGGGPAQNGFYQFQGVCAGSYTIQVVPPENSDFSPTIIQAGSDATIDSDLPPAFAPAPVTLNFVLPDYNVSNDQTIDFGLVSRCNGTIGDFVWLDADNNGVQDTGEAGLAGVVLNLMDFQNHQIATTTTDANGQYHFHGLCDGTYIVEIQPPSGLAAAQTAQGTFATDSNQSPASVTLTVDLGTGDIVPDNTIDFGFVPGSISGYTYSDLNVDLTFDAGDTPIPSVGVILADCSTHAAIASAITDTHGFYQFASLVAGCYELVAPSSANEEVLETTSPLTYTLSAGENKADEDFGYVVPPSATCVIINAVQGIAITPVTLIASGGTGAPYTFSATGLPTGLTMSPDGTIFGIPTVTGTISYAVTVIDRDGHESIVNCSMTVTPQVNANCVSILSVQGFPITPVTLVASGGVGGPYTFSATGLPSGLSMASDGTISGTPTVSGTFSYSVTIKDKNGNAGTLNCSVTVNAPPSANCVSILAVQGFPLTPVTLVASGGIGGPYTFSATGLPAGLSMASDGTISGTPTVSGTFSYSVTIRDKNGNAGTLNCSVTVQANPATLIVVKKTTSASGDGTFTFTVGGAVSTTFSLTTANGTASTTLNNLQSGRYSLTEKTLSGWTQTSANCSDGSPISAINLQPGQTITCTITNSRAKYKTYTQGGWGTVPSGNNPGTILALYFAKLYSAGVSVGGGKIEKFTSQYAIQVYLPEGGTPYKLTANYTNPQPSVTGAGVLGAQTLTLRLNVDFSNAGIFPAGFPNLSYTGSGPLYGKTVAQILSVANAALGGGALPPGVAYGDLATILGNINGNFDGGLMNGGYLQ